MKNKKTNQKISNGYKILCLIFKIIKNVLKVLRDKGYLKKLI